MNKFIAVITLGLVLSGCSSIPSEVWTGGNTQRPSDSCGYIGCATGGLVHYPHEEFGAERQPKRWYGWDWGKTSSAYPPGSPEYIRLRREESDRLKAMGLDPMGRPLPR